MSEGDELFTLRQHFFTGEYKEVVDHDTFQYTGATALAANGYQLRALISLGEYAKAESLLKGLGESAEVDESFKQVFGAYIALAQGGPDSSREFERIIDEYKDNSYVQVLGSIYLVSDNRLDEALNLLQRHENSLEAVLLSVQLLLAQGKVEAAEKQVKIASAYSQDSIIFNLAEAYVNSVKNGENLRGSLYFFQDLSHGHPTVKTLVGQLVLHAQLHEFEAAEEILEKLYQLDDANNGDVYANEYALASIQGKSGEAQEALEALESTSPEHPVIVDYKQKSELFDTIVDKYKDQIVN